MLWKTLHESRTYTPSREQKSPKNTKYSPIKVKNKSEHSFNVYSSASNSKSEANSFKG